MDLEYVVGAYWGPRHEAVDLCADRLCRFLTELAKCDPVFVSWYRKGKSRSEALKSEVHWGERELLVKLLNAGRNRTDIGKSVIPQLGWHIGLWNGQAQPKTVSFSVTCGSYSSVPGIYNSVSVDLPRQLDLLADAINTRKILIAAAGAWEPNWASVYSRNSIRPQPFERLRVDFDLKRPRVDWMVYLKHPRILGDLPRSVVSEKLADGGLVLVLSNRVPRANEEEHLATVAEVKRLIGIPSER